MLPALQKDIRMRMVGVVTAKRFVSCCNFL
jgi:hypothetical protein